MRVEDMKPGDRVRVTSHGAPWTGVWSGEHIGQLVEIIPDDQRRGTNEWTQAGNCEPAA